MSALEALGRNPHVLLMLVLIIVVVFGSSKLPGAARSLGRSLRIFQSEVKGLREEANKDSGGNSTQALSGDLQEGPKPSSGSDAKGSGTSGSAGRDS